MALSLKQQAEEAGLAAAKHWEEALLPARAQWLRCLVGMKEVEREEGKEGGREGKTHTHHTDMP